MKIDTGKMKLWQILTLCVLLFMFLLIFAGEQLDMIPIVWILIFVLGLGLFFAPLFIWHHTAATAQILRRIENKLERLSLARGSELSQDSENSDKLHPDPSPIEDEAKPQSWDCPRCGECSEAGKTLQSNGKLKCPVCGLIAEVESKE